MKGWNEGTSYVICSNLCSNSLAEVEAEPTRYSLALMACLRREGWSVLEHHGGFQPGIYGWLLRDSPQVTKKSQCGHTNGTGNVCLPWQWLMFTRLETIGNKWVVKLAALDTGSTVFIMAWSLIQKLTVAYQCQPASLLCPLQGRHSSANPRKGTA